MTRGASRHPIGAGGVRLVLAVLMILSLLASCGAGCRPRPPASPSDSPEALAAAVAGLGWSLLDRSGFYELSFWNLGQQAASLEGLVVHLEADIGALARPSTPAIALPAEVDQTSSLIFELLTEASWPDVFTVVAMVSPAAGNLEPVEATRLVVMPGGIIFRPIWPDGKYVDFPRRSNLLLKFDPAVDPSSLASHLTVDPPASFEVRPDSNQDPHRVEVHFTDTLMPYTRYTVTVDATLRSADLTVILGRQRALVFSTGRGDYDWFGRPAWSPDGTKLAWVAPGPSGLTLFVGDVDTMHQSAEVTGVRGSPPSFSPDGRYVYYVGSTEGAPSACRLDLQSGANETIVADATLSEAAELVLGLSPNAAFLALQANFGGVDAHSDEMIDVFLADLGSGEVFRLPKHGLTSRLVGWAGGALLVASTYQQFDNSHSFRYNLYAYDPVTKAETPLLTAGQLHNPGGFNLAAGDPSEGETVGAFWTWEAQNLGVHIVHRPAGVWMLWGLGETEVPDPVLLTNRGRYRDVVLSPDATLAAAAKIVGSSWDIVVFDTMDAIERVLATGAAAQFAPSWSADGTRLAFVEAEGSTWRMIVCDPVTDSFAAFQN